MPKNFFLGVGAMKCGTSWLWKYLSHFPNFDFNGIREYHIWDSLYIHDIRRDFLINFFPDNKVNETLLNIFDNNPPYEQYFSGLIKDNVNSTGDITPAYHALTAKHYASIKQRLESVGFDVKVIFLMRDPFDRAWSQAKFMKQHESFADSYSSSKFTDRNNYKHTITELENVFSPEQIYYGIYEEMFTEQKIIDLSKFCGVAPDVSYARYNPNKSQITDEPPASIKQQAIDCYAKTYDFCAQRFPQTKQLWNRKYE